MKTNSAFKNHNYYNVYMVTGIIRTGEEVYKILNDIRIKTEATLMDGLINSIDRNGTYREVNRIFFKC